MSCVALYDAEDQGNPYCCLKGRTTVKHDFKSFLRSIFFEDILIKYHIMVLSGVF